MSLMTTPLSPEDSAAAPLRLVLGGGEADGLDLSLSGADERTGPRLAGAL